MHNAVSFPRFVIPAIAMSLGLAACAPEPTKPATVPEPAPSVVTRESGDDHAAPRGERVRETSAGASDSKVEPSQAAAGVEEVTPDPAPEIAGKPAGPAEEEDDSDEESIEIEPLSEERLQKFLAARLEGGLQNTFGQFSNMFLVMSRIKFGVGVGLMSSSRDVARTELRPVFPEFYKPTLREFLDAIALQTFSEWKYDPTGKFVKSSVKRRKPVDDLAIFEFTKAEREKPYTIKLMDGWKSEDKGHWLMLIPPSFPVGMDIYEMGTYSADKPADEAELFRKVRSEVAEQWARNVGQNASADDMKRVKVGEFDALHFDAMVPSQLGGELHWRQWVFMVGNRCYFIVSTIKPDLEDEIFPDVEVMLGTFRELPMQATE